MSTQSIGLRVLDNDELTLVAGGNGTYEVDPDGSIWYVSVNENGLAQHTRVSSGGMDWTGFAGWSWASSGVGGNDLGGAGGGGAGGGGGGWYGLVGASYGGSGAVGYNGATGEYLWQIGLGLPGPILEGGYDADGDPTGWDASLAVPIGPGTLNVPFLPGADSMTYSPGQFDWGAAVTYTGTDTQLVNAYNSFYDGTGTWMTQIVDPNGYMQGQPHVR